MAAAPTHDPGKQCFSAEGNSRRELIGDNLPRSWESESFGPEGGNLSCAASVQDNDSIPVRPTSPLGKNSSTQMLLGWRLSVTCSHNRWRELPWGPRERWEQAHRPQGWPGISVTDSFIQCMFVEHLLSTSCSPRHWVVTKADKMPCPGGADILASEIQTGNK